MKQILVQFFQTRFSSLNEAQPEMAIELATAILLIEASRADFEQDEEELKMIRELLLDHLSISEEAVDTLLENAHQELDALVSLQRITRLMNEKLSQIDKVTVIELMWKVVYADGEKHHYEEHLLRQVADLLYVSHADFIKARHKAELLSAEV